MSSMRNAVQRRNHKERSQPAEREKRWGLLEKHKDYSKRAQDYNVKKQKLRSLRQKALDRNPDEFYFAMVNKKMSTSGKNATGTVNGNRGAQELSQEAVRLYKTQDLGYVRTMRNKIAKEVDLLAKQVQGIQGQGKKVVFVDDEDEQLQKLQGDDEEREFYNMEESKDLPDDNFEAQKFRKYQQKEHQKLEIRLEIEKEKLQALIEAEEALELQKAKMSKSNAASTGGVNKNGIKYKIRERKR